MSLNIIFMGTPEFAVPILKSLNDSEHKLVCVYTQPPKKRSRGQKILSSPIYEYAKKLNLSVRSPINLNNDNEYTTEPSKVPKFPGNAGIEIAAVEIANNIID